ncbi:anthranilate synthase component 1 [Clostridium collagenovorans DSM 3089]|uniref:Anthranilate synthase component 1 n=1 Tax=Clostridium collagenovorans DSM 3089 TaxID=1121306 RepID=A0A1M5UUR2_9CLOT|nr:anthranilate synthase component I [Clostridium collagenovorans]SHH66650.1 anthranilate synthase component 1 [Clostridium collagenovorans DSM 3089]
MINISENEFIEKKLSKKVFSVISEFRGDNVSAIRIFEGMSGKGKFILESGSKENHFGRYSYISENPYLVVKGDTENELEQIKKEASIAFENDSNLFSFKGGAVGYIGYDAIALYEKKLNFKNKDELKIPSINFSFYKRYICYDNFTHKVYVVDNIFEDDSRTYEEVIGDQREYYKGLLESVKDSFIDIIHEELGEIKLAIPREEFIKRVEKAKEYIVNGDIFQVVLSQRMYCETEKSPFEIYRRLREENPSPYMFYIDYEEYQVIGSSPEILVSVKDDEVITNPIAGTRRRGKDNLEDKILAKDLLEDEKELAEHVMLVDLGRNDIGKVSKFSTVEVSEFMQVEKFSHVMHITSKVKGKLQEGKNCFEALEACLPAGTVSGAPKIRAMEIIEELEDVKRGLYSGAVGYFSYGGNMDMSIAIRTLVLKDKIAYLQAGAGIVYDSIPEKEAEEIENKLLVLKEALR